MFKVRIYAMVLIIGGLLCSGSDCHKCPTSYHWDDKRGQCVMDGSQSTNYPDAIVTEAKKYIGTKYVYGGKTIYGFDCSGFTKYVYGEVGITIRDGVANQYNDCNTKGVLYVSSERQKGDLVFYYSPVSHVAIYEGSQSVTWEGAQKDVGEKMWQTYKDRKQISKTGEGDSVKYTYTGEIIIHASGKEDGTGEFQKVVEVLWEYWDGYIKVEKPVGRPR